MKYRPRVKAAVYVRMAKEESPAAIARQINALLRMVDRNEESLVGVYADDAAGLERPDFQRMLGDAKGGRFAKLYMRDLVRANSGEGELEALNVDGLAIIVRDHPDGPRMIIA